MPLRYSSPIERCNLIAGVNGFLAQTIICYKWEKLFATITTMSPSRTSHASYYRASQRPVAASMVARTNSFGNPSRSIFQTLKTVQLAIRRCQNEREHAAEVIFHHQLFPRLYLCLRRGCLRSQVFSIALCNSAKILFCVVLADSM